MINRKAPYHGTRLKRWLFYQRVRAQRLQSHTPSSNQRLQQDFFTPYTLEQNGLIERFFQSPKGDCVWQQHFDGFKEAQRVLSTCSTGKTMGTLQYQIP